MLRYIMAGLAFLMISNVSYPAVPTIGYKSVREMAGTLLVVGTILGILFLPKEFFFPALMMYVLYGVAKTALFGFLDWRATGDEPVIGSGDPEEASDSVERGIRRRRRRRRREGRERPQLPPGSGEPA
jgi:CDP-diacylglycerol---serine O-phosphatidyltransferase